MAAELASPQLGSTSRRSKLTTESNINSFKAGERTETETGGTALYSS